MATASRMTARQAGLEPQFAALLPELVLGITPSSCSWSRRGHSTPKAPPAVGLDHLHVPQVSVREQAALMVERLRRDRTATFRDLVADADETFVIVARFLALLELFKEDAIVFEQPEALGALTVRWTGADAGDVDVSEEFDVDDEMDEVEDDREPGDDDRG